MPRHLLPRRPVLATLLLAVVVAPATAVTVQVAGRPAPAVAAEISGPSPDLSPDGTASAPSATAPVTSSASRSATTVASRPAGTAASSASAKAPAPAAGVTPAPAATGPSSVTPDASLTPASPGLTGAPLAAALSAAPLRTVRVSSAAALQNAFDAARPGDLLLLDGGTYRGPFLIKSSGTGAHPVVVRPASGANVTLTATLSSPSCNATGPDPDRTLRFMDGASHWVLSTLSINGGVVISGTNADKTQNWQSKLINAKNWQARRAVPSSGARDSGLLVSATAYLSTVVGSPVSSADDIRILRSTITGKGIFGRLTRFGVIAGTTITDIACGTGPALWLSNFSSGWTIRGNDVSKVADSSASHYMHEGIRMGNQSNYNVVTNNAVHDMPGDSRGITTDQDSSWNLITGNTATKVSLGFNDQQAGWGNTWSYNVASNVGAAGFSFRMQDIGLSAPSPNSSTFYAVVSCNRVVASAPSVRGFQAGAMRGVTVKSNAFSTAYVGRNLAGYWAAQGNTFNGTKKPPVSSAATTTGC
ncbi:hypothetical protein V3N99_05970 [Dermatophilaceae bacterium Soc4.6]